MVRVFDLTFYSLSKMKLTNGLLKSPEQKRFIFTSFYQKHRKISVLIAPGSHRSSQATGFPLI